MKPKNLSSVAVLNAVSSFLDYGARVLVSLLITPILVTGLGNFLFGVWQILSRLLSYMAIADLRVTQALKWAVANAQSSSNDQYKRNLIGNALRTLLLMLPVLLATGGILIFISPAVAKVPPSLWLTVRITCAVLVLNVLLSTLNDIPASVLRGMNLGYKRMGLLASLNLLGGILMVGAIFLKQGLIGVAAAQLIVTIILGILVWRLSKKYVSWFGIGRSTKRDKIEYFKLSGWFAGWTIVDSLLIASDVILIGWILSASMVTTYVLTGYGSQGFLAIATIAIGAAAPGIGNLLGKAEYDSIVNLRNEIIWGSCFLSSVFGSIVLLVNRSFIFLWVGNAQFAGFWVNALLVIIAVQFILIRVDIYLINISLNIKRMVVIGAITSAVSILLSILLMPKLKILGLCISVLMGRLIMTFSYPMIIVRLLSTSVSLQFKAIRRPLFSMLMLLVVAAYAGRFVLVSSWLGLAVIISLSIPVLATVHYAVGFSSDQKAALLRRIKIIRSSFGSLQATLGMK